MHTIKEPNGRFKEEDYRGMKNHIKDLSNSSIAKKEEMRDLKKKKLEEKGFYNDNRKEQRLKLMTKTAIDKFIKKITRADLDNAEGKEDFRVLEELIDHCNNKKLLPCVVFTFSKKKINALAEKLFYYDLTNRHEKSKIKQMITHALSTLKPEDRELEQFNFLTEICMNGYAIHHGDLLPLAKEIVELLFSEGLIKVLFATETFAMGINMPTKTVIFHTIRKVHGSEGSMRFLNSSEYVQMSGRAGRRGLDEKGNVIIIVKDPANLPDSQEMVKMMDYPGESLKSKFRVTYQIILNLYNNKDINVHEMMRQSFLEDPKFKEYVTNIKKTEELKKQFEDLSIYECPFQKLQTRMLMEEYVELGNDLREANAYNFRQIDFRKVQLPKFALLLGHNNETQLCLLLKMEKNNLDRYLQVMVVNRIYTEMEVNKEEREREEAKLGIKRKIVLQYEKVGNLKDLNGAVEGTNNEYFFNAYWVRPNEILEVYSERLKFKSQLDDSKKLYA
jgi:antiviral helicase SKI2